jgi:hypothetical protein
VDRTGSELLRALVGHRADREDLGYSRNLKTHHPNGHPSPRRRRLWPPPSPHEHGDGHGGRHYGREQAVNDDLAAITAAVADLTGRVAAVAAALEPLLAEYNRLTRACEAQFADGGDFDADLAHNRAVLNVTGHDTLEGVLLEVADRIVETCEMPPPRFQALR